MQRKATKNTRAANAAEKRFMAFVKLCDCVSCGMDGPSIVDHMYGATFKHNKVLIGMWALLPYCYLCDEIKTKLGRKAHNRVFGQTQAALYLAFLENTVPAHLMPPEEVVATIIDWGNKGDQMPYEVSA